MCDHPDNLRTYIKVLCKIYYKKKIEVKDQKGRNKKKPLLVTTFDADFSMHMQTDFENGIITEKSLKMG